MRHPDAARLNDFADELLPPAERSVVAEHLLVCDACRGRVDALCTLASELAGLPREVAPGRDLRPPLPVEAGKVTAVTSGALNSRRRWLAAAAILAVTAGAGALAAALDRAETTGTPGPVIHAAAAAPFSEVYAAADVQLRALLAGQAGTMAAETSRLLDGNLATLDRAIRELEAARARDPGNGTLTRMLADRYQARLELLRSAAALLAEG